MDFSEIEARFQRSIDEMGWAAQAVAPAVGQNDDSPPYVYSVGFTESLGVPEVVIIGFDPRVSYDIIKTLYDGLSSGRLSFPKEEAKVGDLITNDYQVLFRPIPHDIASNMVTQSFRRPGNKLQEAWHLMLPDVNHKYPGDPECEEKMADIQSIEHFAEYGSSMKPH